MENRGAEVKPTDRDVKFGKGKGYYEHPGNKAFRKLIRQRISSYDRADKGQKGDIAGEVMQAVLASSGRFIEFDKDSGKWYAVTDEVRAKTKVSESFRGQLRQIRKKKEEAAQRILNGFGTNTLPDDGGATPTSESAEPLRDSTHSAASSLQAARRHSRSLSEGVNEQPQVQAASIGNATHLLQPAAITGQSRVSTYPCGPQAGGNFPSPYSKYAGPDHIRQQVAGRNPDPDGKVAGSEARRMMEDPPAHQAEFGTQRPIQENPGRFEQGVQQNIDNRKPAARASKLPASGSSSESTAFGSLFAAVAQQRVKKRTDDVPDVSFMSAATSTNTVSTARVDDLLRFGDKMELESLSSRPLMLPRRHSTSSLATIQMQDVASVASRASISYELVGLGGTAPFGGDQTFHPVTGDKGSSITDTFSSLTISELRFVAMQEEKQADNSLQSREKQVCSAEP